MRVEQSLLNQRATDLLWLARPDGQWDVFEAGDEHLLPAPPTGNSARMVEVVEFRSRFTDSELAGIGTSPHPGVAVLLIKLLSRNLVDLDDPQVVQGLDLLIAQNLIAANRKAQILA